MMTQSEVLANLIKDNIFTDFGREHHFDLIRSWEEYGNYVPLSGYDDYKFFIDEIKQGRKNVLTSYPLVCMLMTSGSSGNPKSIPLTVKALQQYSDLIFSNLMNKVPEGKILHTSVFRYALERKLCPCSVYDPGKSVICGGENGTGDAEKDSGPESYNTLLSAVYYAYLAETGAMDLHRFSGGEKLNFSFEIKDVMFVKAWSALYEKNLTAIQSIFLYDTLMLFDYIEHYGLDLTGYMAEKHIPDEIEISQGIKDYLLMNMMPDDDRLSELNRILRGSCEEIAGKLWPELRLVSGISGNFFKKGEALLKKYLGDVPVNYFAFVSSECMSGIAVDGPDARFRLISDNGYYEFLDMSESDDQNGTERNRNIYNCTNVPTGRRMELVITSWSGLYRYRTGDIVVVDGYVDGMPVIRFICRDKVALDIAGEKTSEEMLEHVIIKFAPPGNLQISDCSVWADYHHLPGRYVILLELDLNENLLNNTSDNHNNDNNNNHADEVFSRSGCEYLTDKLAADFDVLMREVNPDYEDLRGLNAIDFPSVKILPKGYHAVHRAETSQAKPGLIGQSGDICSFICRNI